MQLEAHFVSLKGTLASKFLKRKVTFRFVAPADYLKKKSLYPVLLMNDGQDFYGLNLEATLTNAFANHALKPFVFMALETNKNRLQEYGTSLTADYKGRGSKAKMYNDFVVQELIPFMKTNFKVSHHPEDWVFCGMSLGGLSAFDIVYNNPVFFSKVGVFSGSFWWRNKAYKKNDLEDRSRIVLNIIKNSAFMSGMKFWFQCGTLDETADRNQNGVIDAIDDTLDVIKELQEKGYSYPGDITYVQVEGGKHDLQTWAMVFPQFLEWAFFKETIN